MTQLVSTNQSDICLSDIKIMQNSFPILQWTDPTIDLYYILFPFSVYHPSGERWHTSFRMLTIFSLSIGVRKVPRSDQRIWKTRHKDGHKESQPFIQVKLFGTRSTFHEQFDTESDQL